MPYSLRYTANQAVKAKRETHHGTEYLIAPVIAIKAGVMNEELVPHDEIAAHFGAWDGRPFVLDHPKDAEGNDISANHPDILAAIGVGHFFNSQLVDSKIKGEVWVDVVKARGLGSDALTLLQKLEAGKPVEVSTAYWRDLSKESGEFDGQEYVGVARNLRPDHIAALLDDKGACSWEDGCGVPRVNRGSSVKFNIRSEARRPSYDGTEEISWEDVDKTFQGYRDGFYKHTGADRPDEPVNRVQDAPAQMKSWIASKSLLGDADAEDWRNLSFFPVVNPGTDKLNAGAVRAVLGGRAAQANIPAATLRSAQNMARGLLEKEFKVEGKATNRKRLAGMLHTVAQVLGLIQNEDSLEELPRRVRIAWENEHTDGDGIFVGPWVEEVLDGQVIVREEEGLLSYPFSEEGSGNIDFGQPTRVKVIYHPTSEQEANTMNELIAQIVEDGRLGLNEEELGSLPEALLAKLAEALANLPQVQETELEPEPVPQEEQEPEPQANQAPCSEQLEALIGEFGGVDGMRQLLVNARAITDERKQQLVADVAANSRLTEAQLKAMDEEALIALRAELVPADYSGRGGGSQSSQDEITPLVMPSLFKENGGNNG